MCPVRRCWCFSLILPLTACDDGRPNGSDGPDPPELLRPTAGHATLVVNATSSAITPGPADVFRWALYGSLPPTGRPSTRASAETPVRFPARALSRVIEPGDYGLHGCYDAGGDDARDCAGAGDLLFVYPEPTGTPPHALHSFEAGDILTIDFDLDGPSVVLTPSSVLALGP
jgi:hypothetical protein